MSKISDTYYRNAMHILHGERRKARTLDQAYRMLACVSSEGIRGGIESWFSNPFVRTALKILEKFQKNYKVKQALALLREAGESV